MAWRMLVAADDWSSCPSPSARLRMPSGVFRLAVLSHILPPSPSGQAMVLFRLLRDLSPEDYCLLSRHDYDPYLCEQDSTSRLPARYYHLSGEFQLRGASRVRALRVASNLLEFLRRIKGVLRIIKHEKCGAIIACSGDVYDLPVGYLASRLAHVPFYAYIFDYYSRQWPRRLQRRFAQLWEPTLIKRAAGVIVPNEFLRDEYRRRYHVEPIVIHNACANSEIENKDETPWPSHDGEIKIVYTGAIYHAHYDAFRNFIAAIQQLERQDVKLHIYTAQSPVELEKEDILGPVVAYHNHLAPPHVFKVQRQADILFLPLAFDSVIPEVIRTSAPGKMGEYLASGRPILVHAPVNSFVSWYFKEHNCGVVVDQSEPAMLAEAIERILDDADLRQVLSENARVRAKVDFNVKVAQAEFLRVFQLKTGG